MTHVAWEVVGSVEDLAINAEMMVVKLGLERCKGIASMKGNGMASLVCLYDMPLPIVMDNIYFNRSGVDWNSFFMSHQLHSKTMIYLIPLNLIDFIAYFKYKFLDGYFRMFEKNKAFHLSLSSSWSL